jgi:hypothetical protein
MSKVRKIIFQTPNSLEFRVIFWVVYPAVSPASPPLYRCSLSLSVSLSLSPSIAIPEVQHLSLLFICLAFFGWFLGNINGLEGTSTAKKCFITEFIGLSLFFN